jgi:hypothetical protein
MLPETRGLSELLAWNRDGMLTSVESEELEAFLDKVEAVATEKAAARWLLSPREAQSGKQR